MKKPPTSIKIIDPRDIYLKYYKIKTLGNISKVYTKPLN